MTIKKIYISILSIILSILAIYIYCLKNTLNIAYISDKGYLPYVMTSIYSAIKNKNYNSIYNFYIIAKNFDNQDIKKLKTLETFNVKITVINAEEKKLDYENLGRFKSYKITLQKIYLSTYLDNLDKVLYLDADTIIQEDLKKLYSTDISSVYLAATKDGLMYQHPYHIGEIGLEWRKFYFNSGIMLLNLKKMREDNIQKKSIIYFQTNKEVFGDQDVLNVAVKDKVIPISCRYNLNSTFFEEKDADFLSKFYEEKIYPTPRENYDNAAILHFSGFKPWTIYFTHPYLKTLWHNYFMELKSKYNLSF